MNELAFFQVAHNLNPGSKTALVYDERMALHKNIWSKNHPERPGRVEETMRLLNECGILKRVRTVCAREVTKQEVKQSLFVKD